MQKLSLVIAVIAFIPNLMLGYMFYHLHSLMNTQRRELVKDFSKEINQSLKKQTETSTASMSYEFTKTLKTQLKGYQDGVLRAIPSETGDVIRAN
tara:strand:+ start:321 stop:605 length:285 start_codon:yes stop_codon:yes gene_type:complete